MEEKFKYHTTFDKIVKLQGMQLVMCNNISSVDDSIWENFTENFQENEYGDYPEIYQWFLTNLSQYDVEWFVEHFDLIFTYSEKLDIWILCVTHFGTLWSGVDWYTDLPQFSDKEEDEVK